MKESREAQYSKLYGLIKKKTGIDFSLYKQSSVKRRIKKRRSFLGYGDENAYIEYVMSTEEEALSLAWNILIGVTEFFRDQEAFEALYTKALPELFEGKEQIRIWCAASSTGEEAYSLAILIEEYKRINGIAADYKIIATDVHPKAIECASRGYYSRKKVKAGKDILERYFENNGQGFRVLGEIRKKMIFMTHNLLNDIPFTKIDLLVCRNFLIYIVPGVQRELFFLFHKIMNENGFLFIGNSESAGEEKKAFTIVDKKHKIYRKNSRCKVPEYLMGNFNHTWDKPSVSYQPEDNCRQGKEVSFSLQNETIVTDETKDPEEIENLRQKLSEMEGMLLNARKELELRDEEIQSSYEEIMAANEELQSSNEELQVMNEEVCTVNGEYQEKIKELTQLTDDLDNLLVGGEIGALYIDRKMKIRKITPIVEAVSNLRARDIGRPIYHINFMEKYPQFIEDVKSVSKNGKIIEREIIDEKGTNWLFRVRPYQVKGKSLGILITVFDITKRLESARFELQNLTDSVPGGVVKFKYDREKEELSITYANEGFYQLSRYTEQSYQTLFGNNYMLVIHPEDRNTLMDAIDAAVDKGDSFGVIYRVFPQEGEFWREIRGHVLREEKEVLLQCIIFDITQSQKVKEELVMANKKYAGLLYNLEGGIMHVRFFEDTKSEKLEYISESFLKLAGYTMEEYEEMEYRNGNFRLLSREAYQKLHKDMIKRAGGEEIGFTTYRIRKKDGEYIWIQAGGSIIEVSDNEALYQFVLTDITALKEMQRELEIEKEQVSAIAALSANILFKYDIENDVATCIMKNGVDFPHNIQENYEDYIFSADLIYPDDLGEFQSFYDEFRSKPGVCSTQFRRKFQDGTYRWVMAETKTLCDKDGKPYMAVGKYTDIHEKKLNELALLEESRKDALTGICQRKYFREKVERYISSMKKGEKAAFILLDVDDFKEINDTYGHLLGDTVLINVADGIRSIKDGRIVAGRFGGDEFMVLIESLKDESQLGRVIDAVSSILKDKYRGNSITSSITFSMGIAMIPEDGREFDEIFSRADYALYRIKQEGKNGHGFIRDYSEEYRGLAVKNDRFKTYEEQFGSTRLSISEELVEYIIEIMGGIEDFTTALSIIMDNVGTKFDLSYISFRWTDEESASFLLEQQWISPACTQELRKRQICSREEYHTLLQEIAEKELYIYEDAAVNAKDFPVRAWVAGTGIKSVLQCPVFEDNEIIGIMSFAHTQPGRRFSTKEIKMLKMIAKVLSLHISSSRNFMKIQQKVERMTLFDKVTGLNTYRHFQDEAGKMISHFQDQVSLAIVYSDFTNFKYINDVYGYETGDTILREFAEYTVRDNPSALVGTREYADNVIAMVKIEQKEKFLDNLKHKNQKFEDRQNLKYPGLNLMISSGVYFLTAGDDIVTAVDNANIARKRIKGSKSGGALLFEPVMLKTMNKTAKILGDFPDALANREFYMYLQPQIDLRTEKAVGAEALVRWIKPDHSRVFPDEFIPLLERNGSIVELDFYMLECALAELQSWQEKGKKLIPVSVNFSRVHFYNNNLSNRLIEMAKKYEIEPKYIDVEITERLFIGDNEYLSDELKKIREAGFSISMDDFGTGYSSLSILGSVEVQAIKLDKSFLYGSEKSQAQRNVMNYMISLAKELDLGVVCEGTETKEQIDFLRGIGCTVVQGYYYDKPLPKDEFADKYLEDA